MCSPHSLQHLLDLTFGLRELLCITGAQHHIRVGPVLWIEEWIAPDRDLGIGLAISPSCIPMSPSRTSARTVPESMRAPILKVRRRQNDSPALWVVFSTTDGQSTFFGLFRDERNAEGCAAKIAGARVERVVVRDKKASREVLTPLRDDPRDRSAREGQQRRHALTVDGSNPFGSRG